MSRPGTETHSPGQHVQNFTDREEPLKLILAHLETPMDQWLPALVFWGVGGIGKTWLTLKLQAHLKGTSTIPGFLDSEADAWGRVPKLPCARLDFDPLRNPLGGSYQNDPLAALAEMRAQWDIACPRYDLASTMLQFHQGNGALPLHPLSDHAAHAWDVVKAPQGIAFNHTVPVVGGIVAKETQRWVEKASKQLKKTDLMQWVLNRTEDPFVQELKRADAQQLAADMPRYLAEDLNENLPARKGKRCRAILIFDTYEEMQILDGNTVRQARRDEWIREFFKRLDHVLIILAGRDYVRWAEHDSYFGERDTANKTVNLEQHLLGGLSRKDAGDFLGKCGITAPTLQKAVLRVCVDDETDHPPGVETAYHPFSLGLCADTIANEGGKTDPMSFRMSSDRVQALAQRFLRSLPTDAHRLWVEKLAMTWRFDREAALSAYSDTQSREADSVWNMLTRFSFVIRLGESEWYTLHARMRAVLTDLFGSEQGRLPTEHRWWQTYWQQRSQETTDVFAALAWSHRYRNEPELAIREWYNHAEHAIKSLEMAQHYSLLDWWTPLELELQPQHSLIDASALNTLGLQLYNASMGDRSRNLRRCIACHEAALRVYPAERFPEGWGITQNNLGNAFSALPSGDFNANLQHAIQCYQMALRVCNEGYLPQQWASTLSHLGNAYRSRNLSGDLLQSIDCYQSALRVYTKEHFPQDWGTVQHNLGVVYSELQTGDLSDNIQRAIGCYQSVLEVCKKENAPVDWALAQNNLAIVYCKMPQGDHNVHLLEAIKHYQAALMVYTETHFPEFWAMTLNNLANAYNELAVGDPATNLQHAIQCYEAALRVYTEEQFPLRWATTQNNLGAAYSSLPSEGHVTNILRAIRCYEATLRVHTEESFPDEWAMTQNRLGNAYCSLSIEDPMSLQRAIGFYEAALRVLDEEHSPLNRAMIYHNLGNVYRILRTGDRQTNLERAIECYTMALQVRTEERLPQQWASTLNNLAVVFEELGRDKEARDCRQNAARGYG